MFSTCLFGQTPEDLVKKDYPKLYAKYGNRLEQQKARYVFAIDISNSMKDYEITVKTNIKNFISALPEGDFVTIIQKCGTLETGFIFSNQPVNSSSKSTIFNYIDAIKFDRVGSDGFMMTDKIIEALNQTGSSDDMKYVFMFTDFEYWTNKNHYNKNSENWKSLKTKFERTQKGNFVSVTGLRLALSQGVDPSAVYETELKDIFGRVEILPSPNSLFLATWFNNTKANILRDRLTYVIGKLVKKQNANISLENKNGKIELKGANLLVYHTLVLNEESEKKVAEILNSDKLFSFFPPSDTQIEVSGTLVAENYKSELPELDDVPLVNKKISLMTADSLIPWWLTDIIVIVLLFSILRFIWTIIPPAKLRGSMDFYTPGKSTIVIDCFGNNKKISNNEFSLLKNDFSLEIRATKKFFKGKCLLIYPLNGDLLLDSRKVKKTAVRGKKTIASNRSKWTVDGINITMPIVK